MPRKRKFSRRRRRNLRRLSQKSGPPTQIDVFRPLYSSFLMPPLTYCIRCSKLLTLSEHLQLSIICYPCVSVQEGRDITADNADLGAGLSNFADIVYKQLLDKIVAKQISMDYILPREREPFLPKEKRSYPLLREYKGEWVFSKDA